jgi:hypothetical protein
MRVRNQPVPLNKSQPCISRQNHVIVVDLQVGSQRALELTKYVTVIDLSRSFVVLLGRFFGIYNCLRIELLVDLTKVSLKEFVCGC